MNRLIASLLILCLCCTSCLFSLKYIDTACGELLCAAKECSEPLLKGDIDKAKENAKILEELFDEKNRKLSIILGDEYFGSLHYKIPNIEPLLTAGNYEKALEILLECTELIEEIPKGEKLTFDNIF